MNQNLVDGLNKINPYAPENPGLRERRPFEYDSKDNIAEGMAARRRPAPTPPTADSATIDAAFEELSNPGTDDDRVEALTAWAQQHHPERLSELNLNGDE